MDPKWREILEKVERGELTPEQGAELLAADSRKVEIGAEPAAQSGAAAEAGSTQSSQAAPEPELVEDFASFKAPWKNWWFLPLGVGVLILFLSGWMMASATASGKMFWFYCAILPALLGALVVVLAFWSRTARWLHVRVHNRNKEGRKNHVNISMPIPTGLVGLFIQTFGEHIPGLREQPEVIQSMPDMMKALDTTGDPLIVEVNEPDGGEVRVYIL